MNSQAQIILKRILFPVFSAFLLYRTIDLIRNLFKTNPEVYALVDMLMLSFLLVLFVTGIFAFAGFAYPTSKLLGKKYYAIRKESFLSGIYSIMGVNIYRNILLLVFWGKKKNRKKYFDGTRSGISNFLYQSKQSEFGHLTAFISLSIISSILIFRDYHTLALFIGILNISVNLYPVILQRYHRLRLKRIQTFRH